jgi:putative Mn2+ efflux pump MntP
VGLDIDPVETAEELREDSENDASNAKLNSFVAVAVAILATFMGVCNVKDDNVVQAMLAAHTEKVDQWNFFQARNIREEVMLASIEEMKLAKRGRTDPAEVAAYDETIARYTALAQSQNAKKEEQKKAAEAAQVRYDKLNYKDDQFDLAEASIAVAIALLAITALTHKWWLFWMAMIPSIFGVMIGGAGLLGLPFHPDFLISPLT